MLELVLTSLTPAKQRWLVASATPLPTSRRSWQPQPGPAEPACREVRLSMQPCRTVTGTSLVEGFVQADWLAELLVQAQMWSLWHHERVRWL